MWIGGSIAELGPPGFQALWKHMYAFLSHYIYGRTHDEREYWETGQQALFSYAEALEKLVLREEVWPACTPTQVPPLSGSMC